MGGKKNLLESDAWWIVFSLLVQFISGQLTIFAYMPHRHCTAQQYIHSISEQVRQKLDICILTEEKSNALVFDTYKKTPQQLNAIAI